MTLSLVPFALVIAEDAQNRGNQEKSPISEEEILSPALPFYNGMRLAHFGR